MSEGLQQAWEEWLSGRPPEVQALAREFPINTVFNFGAVRMWIIGYTEGDEIIVSPIDPRGAYQAAIQQRTFLHAQCIRDAMAKRAAASVQA